MFSAIVTVAVVPSYTTVTLLSSNKDLVKLVLTASLAKATVATPIIAKTRNSFLYIITAVLFIQPQNYNPTNREKVTYWMHCLAKSRIGGYAMKNN